MEPGAPSSFYWSPWFYPLLYPASTPRRGQGAAVGCGMRACPCWKAWETPLPHRPGDCALESGVMIPEEIQVVGILTFLEYMHPILLIWWPGKRVLSRASGSVNVSSIKHALQGMLVGSRWAAAEDLAKVVRELIANACTHCMPGTVPLLRRWAT